MELKASSLFLFAILVTRPAVAQLPAQYFRLLASGATQVENRLDAEPAPDLQALETQEGRRQWNHFPFAILVPAVLYAKQHPANSHYHDPRMFRLAIWTDNNKTRI